MSVEMMAQAIREVGRAVRRPEELACRWQRRRKEVSKAPPKAVFAVLLANAVLGTAVYGMVMHMHRGAVGMGQGALLFPTAAGLAWTLAFPALFIIHTALGSRLDFTTTALAALVTVSFGAAAMLASVPIVWFFGLALPYVPVRWAVHLVVFAGVGICMCDVFLRVLRALEPERVPVFGFIWLALLSSLGTQLFGLFGLFRF
jgi:hypothetical protein